LEADMQRIEETNKFKRQPPLDLVAEGNAARYLPAARSRGGTAGANQELSGVPDYCWALYSLLGAVEEMV
jgi:hypothetical protein